MSLPNCYRCGSQPCTCADGCTIYLGDCREVLPSLQLPNLDCIVTDIPYGAVNRESGGLRPLDKGVADEESFPLSFAIEQVVRLASSAYVWCGTEQVSELRSGFVESDMLTRLCIWEKINPSPMNGQYVWLSSIEACVFCRKPGAYFSAHCASPVWRGPIARKQVHPTQKPLWLMSLIMKASAPEGGTVLDFCMGSGTTLLAAKNLRCKSIGIEREERYCEIAARRLDQEVLNFG